MTDREKVIKDLEKIHTHFWVKYRGCGIKAEKAKYKERLSAVADAITLLKEQYETIKELQSAYDYLQKQFFDAQDKLLKEQEEEPNANGWISVKDRLPEKEGQYLCWFGKNIMAKGAAIATYLEMWKSFGSLESLETYPNVTHWMPIESPEEAKLDG